MGIRQIREIHPGSQMNFDLVSRLAEKSMENLDGTDSDSMKAETRKQFVDMVKATVKLER